MGGRDGPVVVGLQPSREDFSAEAGEGALVGGLGLFEDTKDLGGWVGGWVDGWVVSG